MPADLQLRVSGHQRGDDGLNSVSFEVSNPNGETAINGGFHVLA